ncbi:hypothetical protein [Streptosporangium roseum]|uniref:hypothetical protein n=1 Tax=Streptosporangium roseum TaxID=2001 RepID=UPI0004CD13C5|nr:hypothetical protein [Streptosporangium roseum]
MFELQGAFGGVEVQVACDGIQDVGGDAAVRPGQFVIGSFWASDNTCVICRSGYPSSCVHHVLI